MINKQISLTLLAASVAAALAAPTIANEQSTNVSPEVSDFVQFDTSAKNKALKQDYPQYFIVQLSSAPLASAAAPAPRDGQSGNRLDLNAAATQQHAGALAKERADFAQALHRALPGAAVERHFDTVLHAVVVTAHDDIFDQLQQIDGVTAVYREEMYYEQMDASLGLIKAKEVWQQLGGDINAGKGVKVAVIDGGIRPENPMFKDTGMSAPASKPANDYCATVEPTFCNNKLIAARYSTPTFQTVPQEYLSPLGNGGHGTHVAGTVLGMPTTIKFDGATNVVPVVGGKADESGFTEVTVSGVAPGAYLMSYKALFQVARADGSVTGSGSNVMLLEALDWAVKDGADVINNSWGGGPGGDPANSPYQAAFLAAEKAGVVVVTAAGNSGPGAQTVGCPGCIESGITVANTTHGRFFANTVKFGTNEPMMAVTGSVFADTIKGLAADPKAKLIDAATAVPTNALACTAFPADTFKDSFALISRGSCTFTDKINNAMAAGAKGVVMVQNNDGQPTSMSNPGTSIPSLMVSLADGRKLAQLAASDKTTELTLSRFASRINSAQYTDNMSDSSSRGPNGNNNILKPDLGAPGSSILSATSPDGFADKRGFQLMSGTSMASPHVAGAAAVMKQLYPKWTAVEIKTALTSTAVGGIKKEDSVNPATPLDIGAGRLDLSRAVKAGITFDKPSFAQNPCVVNCNFSRTLRNMTGKEVTWTGNVTFTDGNTTGKLDKRTVTLKPYGTPGDSAEFVLSVDGTMSTYGAWTFGQVTWTASDNSIPTATMPIAVRVANTADAATLNIASSTVLKAGEPTLVTASLSNKVFAGQQFSAKAPVTDPQVNILAMAPAGTKLVAGSGKAITKDAQQFLLDTNPANGRVMWTGTMKPANLSVAYGAASTSETLKDANIAAATCASPCDDAVISYNMSTTPITYNGTAFNRVFVSTNGYIQLSNSTTIPTDGGSNRKLPNTMASPALIAPFWTDLDLAGDKGNGTIHVATRTLNDRSYLVVEWNDVEQWDVPGKRYTFQTWLATGAGPEDIRFNYISLSDVPESLTVGVQDTSRMLGTSLYFSDGQNAPTGVAPVSNSGARVNYITPGSVDLQYALELNSDLALGTPDTITVAEDAASAPTDVLANEKTSFSRPIQVEVTSGTQIVRAVNKAAVSANGALGNVTIVSQPTNGQATVTEGKVVYRPKADFNGKDSFTYSATDTKGFKLEPTVVNVTVAPVNDAPTVTAANVTANEGTTVTLTAVGLDVDGDALTYSWSKVSGPDGLTVSGNTASVNVALPQVTANTTATFSVVASDGKLSSTPVTVTVNIVDVPPVTIQKSGGGGSAGYLSLLLLPLLWARRQFGKLNA